MGKLLTWSALVLLGGPALGLAVQLGVRADRAADRETAVRWDARRITVLLDRASKDNLLLNGWGAPELGKGVSSISAAPVLRIPTSTATGDVELTLQLASAVPYEHPLMLKTAQAPVASWRPTGQLETVRLMVPQAFRRRSYDVVVYFDLTGGTVCGGGCRSPPIRLVRASSRIIRQSRSRPSGAGQT